MERTNLFPELVCILDGSHAVENLLAQATEENITSFGIPLLVILLQRSGLILIRYLWKAGDSGTIEKRINGFQVGLHTDFPIWKVLAIEHGPGSFPTGHLAQGGEASTNEHEALIPIERIKMSKRGVN